APTAGPSVRRARSGAPRGPESALRARTERTVRSPRGSYCAIARTAGGFASASNPAAEALVSRRVGTKSRRSASSRILGGIASVPFALLGLGVKGALAPRQRGAGATSVVWGVLFGAYLWWGGHQVGLDQT